jgi:hypothetical protein
MVRFSVLCLQLHRLRVSAPPVEEGVEAEAEAVTMAVRAPVGKVLTMVADTRVPATVAKAETEVRKVEHAEQTQKMD